MRHIFARFIFSVTGATDTGSRNLVVNDSRQRRSLFVGSPFVLWLEGYWYSCVFVFAMRGQTQWKWTVLEERDRWAQPIQKNVCDRAFVGESLQRVSAKRALQGDVGTNNEDLCSEMPLLSVLYISLLPRYFLRLLRSVSKTPRILRLVLLKRHPGTPSSLQQNISSDANPSEGIAPLDRWLWRSGNIHEHFAGTRARSAAEVQLAEYAVSPPPPGQAVGNGI
jgi:hypothetical protein